MTCVLIRFQIETFVSLLFALSRYLQNKGHEGKNHTLKTTLLNQVFFQDNCLLLPKANAYITYRRKLTYYIPTASISIMRDRNVDYKISLIYNMFY